MTEVRTKYLKPTKGKNWVIGDVHGFSMTLKTLVEKLELTKDDRLILLGDLADRGPDVKGVIDYLLELKTYGFDVICVRGNHDDMMLQAYNEELDNGSGLFKFMKRDVIKRNWFSLGGDSTLKSFGVKKMLNIDASYIEFMQDMYHYLEDDNYFYVHGGFDFKRDETFTDTHSMMWIRDFAVDEKKAKGKKVMHGHTPLDIDFIKDVIQDQKRYDFIALDNGIYIKMRGKGSLLAYETKSEQLVQQRVQDIF